MRTLLWLWCLAGCGPYLAWQGEPTVLRSTLDCTQGPLVWRVQAAGARWGERFRLEVRSQRPQTGWLEMRLDGRVVQRSNWRTVHGEARGPRGDQVLVPDERPDNARCVARPQEAGPRRVEEAAGLPPQDVASEAKLPPATTLAPSQSPELPVGPAEFVTATELASWSGRVVGRWRDAAEGRPPQTLATLEFELRDPDLPAPVAAGAWIEVVVWSDEPLDLADVRFYAYHQIGRPHSGRKTLSDEVWRRHLHDEKAKQEAELAKRQAEAKAEAEERLKAWQRRQEAREQHCLAHRQDETCWPKPKSLQPRPQSAPAHVATVPPPPTPPPPPPARPEGPPPTARTETPPMRPSAHAAWVPGYWLWAAGSWQWLAGWWRVPEQDRLAGHTAWAPQLPPPLPHEGVPPPPMSAAVWVAGWWSWSGDAWIWVPGAWRLPPAQGLIWRAARWLQEGVRIRLDPGGWQTDRRR